MNFSLKLQARQSQSLAMTPQLLQSIRLLQFGALELQAFLEHEAEQNPLLEITVAPAVSSQRSEMASTGRVTDNTLDNLPDNPASLYGHALAEVIDILKTPEDIRIGEILVQHLDRSGYIRARAGDIARDFLLPESAVLQCLQRLQAQAEPAGLFADDLPGCLSLQLARRNRLDPVIASVLAHLDLLARRDFAALRRLTGEDEAGLLDILAEIRHLDPRPGMRFAHDTGNMIIPDVIVEQASSGHWRVQLNQRALPRVLITSEAETMVRHCGTEHEQQYLAQCRSSAGWLIRSLDQRAKSILRVASEIVRRQTGFLQHGMAGLKPMTLAAIAESVDLHESTVSRVAAGKYIQTPRGTFEFKQLFSAAIGASSEGDSHSAESVKQRIKRLIASEALGRVLSDDDIAAYLKRDGIDVARRTVAKYRESQGIGSSVQRRREMAAKSLVS
ncbi:RNA polymerase factor sigma-54 [Aureimonas fodinaquatilis]|uniref:RNA polymerase sigma-54 factor n=1 Tax=Aureimonas fodinaquatilis TaxID=2565783 RepID=A0A5B0DQ45_9HYPH|nr:RNA polymerase factor sigma-54 [Aureimonas fodinaquatilis]KAA0968543.1 RNA polymerase factor sigma-54 [Aureimonas fodinaquatilis]